MKVKMLYVGLLSVSLLSGCNFISNEQPDRIEKPVTAVTTNRFISTNDSYNLDGMDYKVCYDSKTNIVYLVHVGGYANTDTTILYGQDKLPMTIDEYNKTK